MIDISERQPAEHRCVEPVSRRQEILKIARLESFTNLGSHTYVRCARASAFVLHSAVDSLDTHIRPTVGKSIKRPPANDRRQPGSLQTEEPDPRFAIIIQ